MPPTLTGSLLESEDYLPELSAMLVLLCQFPLFSASHHFSWAGFLPGLVHWTGFLRHSGLHMKAGGLLLYLASASLRSLQPGYIRVTAERCVRRVRNFLGSVSMQQIFEMGEPGLQAWLQSEFYLVKKDNTPTGHEGGWTLKEASAFLK